LLQRVVDASELYQTNRKVRNTSEMRQETQTTNSNKQQTGKHSTTEITNKIINKSFTIHTYNKTNIEVRNTQEMRQATNTHSSNQSQ
jgi:hypothetical protein